MFCLIDSPSKEVRKRVPKDALVTMTAIETYVAQQLENLPAHRQEIAMGVCYLFGLLTTTLLGFLK